MSGLFSKNLKKFRQQKGMTQEQAAAALGVNAQTVSRWECGTTLPDVTLLPELARLYCVTADDFFQETSSVYENYAQRLACVYEKTRDPEDFLRADLEFRRLRKNGACSPEDTRMHGMIHQFMMWYCQEQAMAMYDQVIDSEAGSDSETYWMTRYAKVNLCVLLGRAEECIRAQAERTAQCPGSPGEWCLLIRACYYAKRYEEGLGYFLTALERFPEHWRLRYDGGDVCWKLGRYEEAFRHWDKSLSLNPGRPDALYSKAACYEERGEYAKARETRLELARRLRKGGYDIEADAEERRANARPSGA
ncbi:MAG: helix-turn-helix domain-containing protein [Candidatus Enterenecus sp.]